MSPPVLTPEAVVCQQQSEQNGTISKHKTQVLSSLNLGFTGNGSSDDENMANAPLLEHEAELARGREDLGGQYGSRSGSDDSEREPQRPQSINNISARDQNSINRDSGQSHNADPDVPQYEATRYLYLLAFFSAIGGFLFGYDTGVISGAMLLLQEEFKLSTIYQELIVSVTVGTAGIFALVGGYFNDSLGRRPMIIAASVIFTVGAILMGAAVSKEMLLTGRIVVGMGIGFASMTVPMYIAESSPPHLRGRLVTLNNAFITGGQFVASIVDGLFSYDKSNGWRYMLGLAAVPSSIQFVGFMCLPESPRWLVRQGKLEEAQRVLMNIRGTPQVTHELAEIRQTCSEDHMNQRDGCLSTIWQMLTIKHVRKALIVGCLLQMFQQITGINTVMYYSATIIKMSGIQNNSMAIWLSSITAGTNFLFTLVGLYLVEKIGRRKLTLSSLAGTMISLGVLAAGFQMAAYNSPPVDLHPVPPSYNETSCYTYSTCDQCMFDNKCGFCYDSSAGKVLNSSCIPVLEKDGQINPDYALYGRCSKNPETVKAEWAYHFCPTRFAWMSVFGLILYLASFAPGMGPMPWTVNSEIYPLWARSTGNSIATMTNWMFNLLISMTFLSLTETLNRYGAFWLYAGFALTGLIILSLILPETKGKTLEEMEDLFKKPWCSRRGSL